MRTASHEVRSGSQCKRCDMTWNGPCKCAPAGVVTRLPTLRVPFTCEVSETETNTLAGFRPHAIILRPGCMSHDQHVSIKSFELDTDPRSDTYAGHKPPSSLPAPQPADDEAAALLDGTNGQSSAAHGASSPMPASRDRRTILLATAAAATLGMLLTIATAAFLLGRRAPTAPASAPAASPDQTAAPFSDTEVLPRGPAVTWGMSMHDVPVPQDVSMPPYTTNVRPTPRRRRVHARSYFPAFHASKRCIQHAGMPKRDAQVLMTVARHKVLQGLAD